MNAAVFVAAILLSIFFLILLSTYNGLIHLRQDIRRAWGRMDDQLKERYGLVATLIQLVQNTGGEMASKLPAVISAKNSAAVAFNPTQLATAEAALTVAIHQIMAAIEFDATLKSNPNFSQVCAKLVANQKQINQTCRRYNDAVHTLNASMSGFPHVMTAKAIGLQLQPVFDLGM